MLKAGMDIETIAAMTGLTPSEITVWTGLHGF
jgi:hypothetical protein